jgi:uncharacterized protein (DUF427 family)
MPKAIWNGAVLANSDNTVIIEGNHYFPADSLDEQFFRESPATSTCGWKGEASYYDLVVEGAVNEQAAWFYPNPKPAALEIKDHVAFWRGVQIAKES